MKTDELISHIRGLKAPSQQQQLLVALADKQEKSKEDERKLGVLIRAEIANRKAAEAKAKVSAMLADEKKKAAAEERKARNHRLILQGSLIDLAGLEGWSRGELLGLLLAAAGADENKRQAWKARGDSVISEHENPAR